MATKALRRPANRPERSAYSRPVGGPSKSICIYWAAGRCTKESCRFLHPGAPESSMNLHISKQKALVWTKEETATGKGNAYNAPQKNNAAQKGNADNAHQKSIAAQKGNATQKSNPGPISNATQTSNAIRKSQVCKYWVDGNCVKGDRCLYLHKWFSGKGFSMLAKLQGHKKAVTGIALPERSNKLYSAGKDGAARVWDCHNGQCDRVVNLGDEAGCLVSEGPWIFIGVPNLVKAWNIESNVEFNLDGPAGQVHAIVVGKEMLFAGAQDGVIYVWKGCPQTNSFVPAATLKGHTGPVVCLIVGANRLYSGSVDHTIRVWDLDTLQCVMTLKGHSGAVMSLICWDKFLLSCSLDCTIKVWAATERGSLEVTYTHSEEHGVLDLAGMTDPETKPILLCSCNDNSVRLLELPSFSERGRLFAKREIRRIGVGPGGLFFSGDATGLVSVWKWMEPYNKVESS
ncbi:zinc finger CCCH domain-containing protein 48-like [Pyrus ussuriensis x Pyrus communis]|uniref:Zinc finger CCCH domain-containing protein 48-like n=1 Tax=Pyrus ussuriensis x Pyrus communis TaxID=2448454 RepID=A0A5N5HIK8_9ROSA|nr:zinc finger CCCH domain-containing protein 48-like [Pyrus ussuriensis x Pyrus communis]